MENRCPKGRTHYPKGQFYYPKGRIHYPKEKNHYPKGYFTTQKEESTTQKMVLEYFRNNPKETRVEAANALDNITEDGVKFIIGKLQQKGLLKRVGGRKHGEWQVLIEE